MFGANAEGGMAVLNSTVLALVSTQLGQPLPKHHVVALKKCEWPGGCTIDIDCMRHVCMHAGNQVFSACAESRDRAGP